MFFHIIGSKITVRLLIDVKNSERLRGFVIKKPLFLESGF